MESPEQHELCVEVKHIAFIEAELFLGHCKLSCFMYVRHGPQRQPWKGL